MSEILSARVLQPLCMSRLPSEEFTLLMLENESKGKKGNKELKNEIQRACVFWK